MIRIDVEWDFISPVLRVASGILSIIDIDFDKHSKTKTLLQCKVKLESGSTGFTSIDEEGYSGIIFEAVRPHMEIMLHSYFDGLVLNKQTFLWVSNLSKEDFQNTNPDEDKKFKEITTITDVYTLNKINDSNIIKVGVCGICKTEHKTYKGAVNCCSHLKKGEYNERPSGVFEMRNESNI